MLSLIAFSGLLFGILLGYINPEELKPGKKYFKIFCLLVLFSILLVLFFSYKFSIIGLALGVAIGFFLKKEYFYLGLSVVASYTLGLNLLLSSLVFVYGLPYGSLLILKSKKIWKEIMFDLILFLIPFLLLINNIVSNYINIFVGFLIGALVMVLTENVVCKRNY